MRKEKERSSIKFLIVTKIEILQNLISSLTSAFDEKIRKKVNEEESLNLH